ncbi:MAG: hypothetical protein ABIX01_20475 [Chitinophagaceae bacterium]
MTTERNHPMKTTPPVKNNEFDAKSIKVKVNKKLDSIEDAPFFKKKMAKGMKMLAIAGLPK